MQRDGSEPYRVNSPICDATGKACFESKHSALASLTGQLKSKNVRVYRCTANRAHFHVTKATQSKIGRGKQWK